MNYFFRIFAPTNNRRLNELVGFLLCVSALLLFLALASYSPLDPSLNSASVLTGSRAARNWIGVVGALGADLLLQGFGLGAFLIPVFPAILGVRWFRSHKVASPIAKTLGGVWLLVFLPAMLSLLPGHTRWMHVIPIEGLVGRIVGDFLIHFFNLAGAYIVCASVLAVALYLTTAFSFSSVQLWAPTRFAFAIALWERYKDWQEQRAKQRMQKELEKRRASPKPLIQTQLVQARNAPPAPVVHAPEPRRSGIERAFEEEESRQGRAARQPEEVETGGVEVSEPQVVERADSEHQSKTILPKIAGGFKLPPSSLLHRADEQQVVDADELK
jgi:DNA segregation ATPase FtsK/SpoIIIE, S-DNA-T family